ncbi:TlpA family protein disulfide reductase [Spirosoma linguale]|uniref:Redoxin domain protein n=1 Tax=Spirosoma linguale (strain ATCC 33905 / DSM 74 / LMG 10896 / Claus 1) TaxID=504472 RepID=D2QIF7_SPILD|nr:Redoxin domain protein [Spirosoma linguale DSM 74]
MTRFFLFLLLMLSIELTYAQSKKDPLPIGLQAPKLEFKDLDNNLVSLEHLRGNIIVLNFWNIGCLGCEQERETLNRLSDSLQGKSIKFVSITLNKKEKIAAWLAKHPITYEFVGNVDFMGVSGSSFFNYRCMPTTVVIDQNGIVQYNQCGPIMTKEESDKFAKLLVKL